MRLALTVLTSFALAAALGLGATWWTVANGLPASGIVIGAWRAEPGSGSLGADPYQRAGMARRGEAPLASGDGLSFTARTDDAGRVLTPSCDYQLEGELPSARLWTLSLFDGDGGRLGDPTEPTMTSATVVRVDGAPLVVSLSKVVRPRNWARLTGDGPFVLRLSLYDTVLGTPLDRTDHGALLSIRRSGCR